MEVHILLRRQHTLAAYNLTVNLQGFFNATN